ncbi:hypothetical protein ACXZ7E_02625 [Paenibacillus lautus]
MNTIIRQQLAEVKSKVLELTSVLIHEPEEKFDRRLTIKDLISLSEEIHHIEGLGMKTTHSRETAQIRSFAMVAQEMKKERIAKTE